MERRATAGHFWLCIYPCIILCGSDRVHLALGLLNFLEALVFGVDKLKLLRAWPISKISIVRASVKRPCSRLDFKGEIIWNKLKKHPRQSNRAFMASQRTLQTPFAWGPQIGSSNSQEFLSYLMKVNLGFDRELVVVIILYQGAI